VEQTSTENNRYPENPSSSEGGSPDSSPKKNLKKIVILILGRFYDKVPQQTSRQSQLLPQSTQLATLGPKNKKNMKNKENQ